MADNNSQTTSESSKEGGFRSEELARQGMLIGKDANRLWQPNSAWRFIWILQPSEYPESVLKKSPMLLSKRIS